MGFSYFSPARYIEYLGMVLLVMFPLSVNVYSNMRDTLAEQLVSS